MNVKPEKIKEKLNLIAQDNGPEVVLLKLAEECSEYAAAVTKYMIGEGSREDVLKELADITVVLCENDIVMSPFELARVHEIMEDKINRQVERIRNGKPGSSCTGCMGAANGDCDGCTAESDGIN